ncbi:type IV pili methyl-accepting chemotaxis transducer N-terminal domain-containing protein [Massilia sp. W12]|uniref:type IV pili methyl-accepting chemotaxis transducer N-terminal domain-containing protein n=1 Tax=Massilia sp. W12 TaxID=3126507 RepID=UPI0030D48D75
MLVCKAWRSDGLVLIRNSQQQKARLLNWTHREAERKSFVSVCSTLGELGMAFHVAPGANKGDIAGQHRQALRRRRSGSAPLMLLALVLLALALLAGVAYVFIGSRGSTPPMQTLITADALMHSQRIAKAAPRAMLGDPEAFKQLHDSRKEFNNNVRVLLEGGNYQGDKIQAPSSDMSQNLKELRMAWQSSDKAADSIFRLKTELTGISAAHEKMKDLTPVLQELSEQVTKLKVEWGGTPREIHAAAQLSMLTQRLAKNALQLKISDGVDPEVAFMVGKDASTFRDIVDGLLDGSEALKLSLSKDAETRDRLTELKAQFAEYQKHVNQILGLMPKFIAAKQAEQLILSDNENLKQTLIKLQKKYRGQP